MSDPLPLHTGWYPDPETGGTRYWDGRGWAGSTPSPASTLPPSRALGLLLVLIGGLCFCAMLSGGVVEFFGFLGLGCGLMAAGLYMFRHGGWLARMMDSQHQAQLRKVERKEQHREELRIATLRRLAPMPATDRTTAARIHATNNPMIAESLQALDQLLRSGVITQDEFQIAKARLLGPA